MRRSLIEFSEAFFVSGATILLVFWLIGQPLQVTGDSMLPTFSDHEQIVAEKLSFKFNRPARGDVVIFRHPDNKRVFAIKRVVGLPGEKIGISGGKVLINGQELPEPYLVDETQTWGNIFLKEDQPAEIPENSYILLGDNRRVSLDSRAWGFVPEEDLIGKPVLVYSPISSFRIL